MERALERTLAEFFRTRGEFAAVYLFGSQARQTARGDSDVDLGLLHVKAPPSTLLAQPFELEAELARVTGKTVQCVVLNTAPPDLVHRVLRDGVLVAEHDRSRRIAFEVQKRNEYFDLAPVRERYRRRAS